MKVLIQDVLVVDPNSSFNRQRISLSIDNGVISKIAVKIPRTGFDTIIDGSKKYVSPGWFDLRVTTGDPGFEHRETLESASKAAMAGGFTGLALLPNTEPVIQSKNDVSYLIRATEKMLVDFVPLGAITRNTKGLELTEMLDLSEAGAEGFTDGCQPIWHSGILTKALQYLQKINKVLINQSHDPYLSFEGVVSEGVNSTLKGLKGIPHLSEELAISRDLDILRYAGGRLHFSTLSTTKGVDLIRKAKKEGLNVTADVAAHHLVFTDATVSDIDSKYKVFPPFRLEKDRKALVKGLADGTIDCIVSDHQPFEEDMKKQEFDLAAFGSTGLETSFSVALKGTVDKLDVEQLVKAFSINPRKILGLHVPKIEKNEKVNLTVFDTDTKWNYGSTKSKSVNSAFLGDELSGRVAAVLNNSEVYINQ